MYKPLPESLTIKQSDINGLGLFTKEDIDQGTNLGMSHLELGQKIIRTPLGGFINHSNTPNCAKIKLLMTRQEWNHRTDLPNNKFNINFKVTFLIKWLVILTTSTHNPPLIPIKYTTIL
jgi:hypothetical protein